VILTRERLVEAPRALLLGIRGRAASEVALVGGQAVILTRERLEGTRFARALVIFAQTGNEVTRVSKGARWEPVR
jgi:hypothetical protein